MTLPLNRVLVLTDAGAVPYSEALAAYDGTPSAEQPQEPEPAPAPGTLDFSDPANSGLI